MEAVVRTLAFLAGATLAGGVVASAVRTVVVPRAEQNLLSLLVFTTVRRVFAYRVRRAPDWESSDRIMARYAAVALVVLPVAWMSLMVVALSPMFWALGSGFPRQAVTRAGSSLLTLGFALAEDLPETILSFVAATIGLGLVALLISFLPSMYTQFSRREVLVGQLDTRAGTPPDPAELLRRAHRIGWLEQLDDLWIDWDRWFVEVEESHTSYTALPFFRSQHSERSWITAAGCVLDTAALRAAAFDLPRTYRAELCLRSGYLALRRIADAFGIEHDPAPAPDGPISVTREELDHLLDRLAADGAPVRPDRDQVWHDFRGWRVNYDAVLIALCGLVVAPAAPWSSDRSALRPLPTVRGLLRARRL